LGKSNAQVSASSKRDFGVELTVLIRLSCTNGSIIHRGNNDSFLLFSGKDLKYHIVFGYKICGEAGERESGLQDAERLTVREDWSCLP